MPHSSTARTTQIWLFQSLLSTAAAIVTASQVTGLQHLDEEYSGGGTGAAVLGSSGREATAAAGVARHQARRTEASGGAAGVGGGIGGVAAGRGAEVDSSDDEDGPRIIKKRKKPGFM